MLNHTILLKKEYSLIRNDYKTTTIIMNLSSCRLTPQIDFYRAIQFQYHETLVFKKALALVVFYFTIDNLSTSSFCRILGGQSIFSAFSVSSFRPYVTFAAQVIWLFFSDRAFKSRATCHLLQSSQAANRTGKRKKDLIMSVFQEHKECAEKPNRKRRSTRTTILQRIQMKKDFDERNLGALSLSLETSLLQCHRFQTYSRTNSC